MNAAFYLPSSLLLTFLFTLLSSYATAQQQTSLGIFVRRRWRNYTMSPNSNDPCEATSCASRIAEGCLPSISAIVEHACISRSFTGRATSRYVALNSTHYCGDVSCGTTGAQFNDTQGTCTFPSRIGECTEGDPSSTDIIYVPDFCIVSNIPVGNYITPMYENRIYENSSSCQEQSNEYVKSYIPTGKTCLPSVGSVVDGTRVLGSAARTCNQDGSITVDRFTDLNCSEQDPGSFISPKWVLDGCTASEASWEQDEPFEFVNWGDCHQDATFYCKDLSEFEFFGTFQGDGSSSSSSIYSFWNLGCAALVGFIGIVMLVG